MKDGLSFLPLGGVGRIGMNNMVLCWRGARWLVDCGVMFPDERSRFADKVLPDLGWIRRNRESLKGIVLTHGHEDHIGALPFVLEICPVPVYGSPFTLGLVRERLAEHDLGNIELRTLEPGMAPVRPPESPELAFSMIRVTHSIPDAASLVIETPAGVVLHTGDFKIEDEPLDGQAFDREGFRALGDRGVLLMMSDSTGAQVPGHTRPEWEVRDALRKEIAAWPGRVVVALFASNLHRLRALEQIAEDTGRRLCLVGRSLQKYPRVAAKAGIASINMDRAVDADRLDSIPWAKQLVAVTGTQAERRATLSRASRDDQRYLRIQKGDLILMSARFIPGNEEAIHHMIGELTLRGATVLTPRGPSPIHTSGHAQRDELAELIRLVRPQHFVPVHGEYAFLRDHEELARQNGVTQTLVLKNGEEFSVDGQNGLARIAEHELHHWFYDGSIVGEEDTLRFSDRRSLFHNGALSALVRVRNRGKRISASVELQSRGVFTEDEALLDRCEAKLVKELSQLSGKSDDETIEDVVHTHARRFFRREVGKKPTVITWVVDQPERPR